MTILEHYRYSYDSSGASLAQGRQRNALGRAKRRGNIDTHGTQDFVLHYFTGKGETVQLSDWNLDDNFERSKSVNSAATEYIEGVIAGDITGPARTAIDSTLTPKLFPLGDGWLQMDFIQTPNGGYQFEFKYDDWFRDPSDIFDILPFDFELPHGEPYQIKHEWRTSG